MPMRKPNYKVVFKGRDDGDRRAEFADREWGSLLKELTDSGALTDQRMKIADRLVRERVGYEFLFPIVEDEGATIVGPNGGDVWNSKWSELCKHKDHILKLEEALKLTVDRSQAVKAPPTQKTKADKYIERISTPH